MAKTIAIGKFDVKVNGIQIDNSIKCNPGNYQNKTSRKVEYLVFHYTANKKDTAKNNALNFKNNVPKVSAHFFVDDNSIYQSVDLNDIAWHCGTTKKYYHSKCRNKNSIGIEMCCTAGNYRISEKTVGNAAYLGASLCELLGITSDTVDTYCLRHYDVTHKTCPAQMVEDVNEWNSLKTAIKTILKAKEKKAETTSFFPARGYFKKGDSGEEIHKICEFFANVFYSYLDNTKETARVKLLGANGKGDYFGPNLYAWTKEFQRRTGLEQDGCIGPITLAMMKKFGFKEN